MSKFFNIIDQLSQAGIHYSLASYRKGMVMIIASVPGRRIEIEISDDGEIEVESFLSDGVIDGENGLMSLIKEFSDNQ